MKQIILSLVVLFAAGVANAQNVFKLGTTVKGKHVTYEVKPIKPVSKYSNAWMIRNVHNVDTVLKEIPYRSVIKRGFFEDLSMQIGIILHDHLSAEEVTMLKEMWDRADGLFEVVLRVDSTRRKLLQVTCFAFENKYVIAQERAKRGVPQWRPPVAYDGFWLDIDPDRLYAIEKDIVKRLVLPEDMEETYLVDDFEVFVDPDEILDPEKAKAKRAAEEAERKKWIEHGKRTLQRYLEEK